MDFEVGLPQGAFPHTPEIPEVESARELCPLWMMDVDKDTTELSEN